MPRLNLLRLVKLPAVAALLVTIGCANTVTLDMRNIEEPVMLNALPYANRDWTVTEVGRVRASVDKDSAYISNANHSWSSSSYTNDAEVKVYEKVGGYESRSVSGVSIRVSGFGVNLLFAYLGGVTVDFTGSVVELDSLPRAQNDENESGPDSVLETEK